MRLKNLFQRGTEAQVPTKSSAHAARERLKIVLSHERTLRNQPDFLPNLQRDILEVVKRYMAVSNDQVNVQMECQEMTSVLEINVTLPQDIK